MLERLKKYRRDLHQIPELELTLPKTSAYVLEILKKLPCDLSSPIASSICAFFDANQNETIAFRADMDALAIIEVSKRDYKSKHAGIMHACGHDGHMAMLLEFAQELSTYYKELNYNILLIFQPGEESPGGAKPICDTGLLQMYCVKQIFGFHLWPLLPQNTIATRKGEFMARTSEINIEVFGKSAHCAKAEEGIDSLFVSTHLMQALYEMLKEMEPNVYRLLKFGKMSSGTARNVVSNYTHIEGSVRAYKDVVFQYMVKRIKEIGSDYEARYGVEIKITLSEGYPAVFNNEALVEDVLKQLHQEDIQLLEKPEMVAEDFAYYQKVVPGMFFFLGTGTGISLHADNFDFDEKVLLKGVEIYKKLSRLK